MNNNNRQISTIVDDNDNLLCDPLESTHIWIHCSDASKYRRYFISEFSALYFDTSIQIVFFHRTETKKTVSSRRTAEFFVGIWRLLTRLLANSQFE